MNNQKKPENRTYPLRMPKNWETPYPSFESGFDPSVIQVSMMVAGCQFEEEHKKIARNFIVGLSFLFKNEGNCSHVDISHCEKDSTGSQQYVIMGYWLNAETLDQFNQNRKWKAYWEKHSGENFQCGIFRELFNVPMTHFETLHSNPEHLVGIANTRAEISEPIQTHAYWGSMRDRIPDSGKDAFPSSGKIEIVSREDHRIIVKPCQNIALIRSGQDLSQAVGKEREEYYDKVQPTLTAGMEFLRDEGQEINCIDCRFMTFLDDDGRLTDHTFGLAYFASLGDLEKWSEHHPTHLSIFNAFLEFAPRYGANMKSSYWHEVSVLPANGQLAEYVNCKPGTGFLGYAGE